MADEEKPKVGYNYTFQADLGSGKTIGIVGNLPVGATKEVMNTELDKVRTVFNRQLANTVIPAIEDEIDGIDRSLKGLKEDLGKAEERFEGKRLPDNEKAAHENIKVTLRNLEMKRADKVKFLEKTRKEAE